MRIALDATPLTEPTGGISRYTAELTKALAAGFPEDEFRLLSDRQFPPILGFRNLRAGDPPTTFLERRWWLYGLPRELARHGVEIFHGTDFAAPYRATCPSVITLHDLSPWRDRTWRASSARVRRRTPWLLRLGLATLVLTPSEAVRREAISRFGIAPDRIVAVPLAASAHFRPTGVARAQTPYVLFVGTLEPRKNIDLLIAAWREVRQRREVRLLLVGRRRGDFPEPIAEPGLEILGALPDQDLPGLYSGCLACVYPSFYEGFGLPVVEAMQCGAAVIASRDPAIEETAGGAAITLDPGRPRQWAEAIQTALDNPAWLNDLRSRSLARAAEFSWPKTARRTRDVYDEAVRRFRA